MKLYSFHKTATGGICFKQGLESLSDMAVLKMGIVYHLEGVTWYLKMFLPEAAYRQIALFFSQASARCLVTMISLTGKWQETLQYTI